MTVTRLCRISNKSTLWLSLIVPALDSTVAAVFLISISLQVLVITGRIHYNDVIMSTTSSQITGLQIVCSGADQRKHQSPALWPLWGNPPVTGGFSSQRASDAENVSIWLRLQVNMWLCEYMIRGYRDNNNNSHDNDNKTINYPTTNDDTQCHCKWDNKFLGEKMRRWQKYLWMAFIWARSCMAIDSESTQRW